MNYQEFKNKYNGKGIDFDGFYGFQCMDLYQQYNKEVIDGPHIPSNASGVWSNYPKELYDRIENTPEVIPQEGDIVIWNNNVGGGYGHIAVFDSGDIDKFVSFDQNWPVGSVSHLQNHTYTNVSGWLRPKNLPQPIETVSKEKYDIDIASRDNQIRERDEEIRKLVGQVQEVKEKLRIIELELDGVNGAIKEKDQKIQELKEKLAECENKPPISEPEPTVPQISNNSAEPQFDIIRALQELFMFVKNLFKK